MPKHRRRRKTKRSTAAGPSLRVAAASGKLGQFPVSMGQKHQIGAAWRAARALVESARIE